MRELDFSWNGKVASDYGIKLQTPIMVSELEPDMEAIKVPGKNGDLHTYTGAFKNRTATASCFVVGGDVESAMDIINDFVYDAYAEGYKRLIVSDDQEHYWAAQVTSANRIEQHLNHINAFEIVWTIRPQKCDVNTDEDIPIEGVVQALDITEAGEYTINAPAGVKAYNPIRVNVQGGISAEIVTQAEYDALPSSKLSDNVIYFVRSGI